jgi:large subunit ribosomal protein L6
MQSFLLPANVKLSQAIGYIKLEGPFGSLIKKIGDHKINLITTSEGARVFSDNSGIGLSSLRQLVYGVAYGFRQRLRLTGIGFRGFITKQVESKSTVKGFRRKRILQASKNNMLGLKLGFSHDIIYCNSAATEVKVNVSRPESRSKGTLISLISNSLQNLKQASAEIRSFRMPDIYKGKGIYYDNQVIKLKKGKRQG